MVGLTSLPFEVLSICTDYIEVDRLPRLRFTCRQFKEVIDSQLWRNLRLLFRHDPDDYDITVEFRTDSRRCYERDSYYCSCERESPVGALMCGSRMVDGIIKGSHSQGINIIRRCLPYVQHLIIEVNHSWKTPTVIEDILSEYQQYWSFRNLTIRGDPHHLASILRTFRQQYRLQTVMLWVPFPTKCMKLIYETLEENEMIGKLTSFGNLEVAPINYSENWYQQVFETNEPWHKWAMKIEHKATKLTHFQMCYAYRDEIGVDYDCEAWLPESIMSLACFDLHVSENSYMGEKLYSNILHHPNLTTLYIDIESIPRIGEKYGNADCGVQNVTMFVRGPGMDLGNFLLPYSKTLKSLRISQLSNEFFASEAVYSLFRLSSFDHLERIAVEDALWRIPGMEHRPVLDGLVRAVRERNDSEVFRNVKCLQYGWNISEENIDMKTLESFLPELSNYFPNVGYFDIYTVPTARKDVISFLRKLYNRTVEGKFPRKPNRRGQYNASFKLHRDA